MEWLHLLIALYDILPEFVNTDFTIGVPNVSNHCFSVLTGSKHFLHTMTNC